MGFTHGAGHLTVKLPALIVAGAISSLNAAVIAVFVATSAVGPGIVVTGTVDVTMGRVVSGAIPVVKVHTKLLANAMPVVSVAPVVIVAVHTVLIGKLAAGVKVATRLAAT